MRKEQETSPDELVQLAEIMAKTFVQQRDLHARQLGNGSYICVHEPLNDEQIIAHLRGGMTLGAYVLNIESETRFIVLDADDDHTMKRISTIAGHLADADMPVYIEKSRRGGHLWAFFKRPISGKEARIFGHGLLAYHELHNIELFPKQDRLNSGPGSLIRLPFGVHRKSGRRYGFFLPGGQPLAPTLREQIRLLARPDTVPEPFFEWFSNYKTEQSTCPTETHSRSKQSVEATESPDSPVSERIKLASPVRDFVADYVQLTAAGTGKCPFHNDNVASFSVNSEENYWHCFACGTGGSVIDFWILWKDCDFMTAVKELASMLL